MIIIDFDDTLFDTESFKQARFKKLEKLGIDEDIYWETYKKARGNPDKSGNYSDEMHAQMLAEKGFNKEKVILALNSVTNRFKDFLFFDADGFLKKLKSLNQPMVLLTHGDPGFQEFKVKGIGISRYFDKIFITQDAKDKILKKLLDNIPGKKVWFINDKVEETMYLSKKFPQLRPILKISEAIPIEEYKKSGLPYFNKLEEICRYILKFEN